MVQTSDAMVEDSIPSHLKFAIFPHNYKLLLHNKIENKEKQTHKILMPAIQATVREY